MSQENSAGIAFGLVLAAAAATGIGSSLVFFPSLVKLTSRRTLAFALAMSAGVMGYISMVDIYSKSIGGFLESGHDEDLSFIYATLSFFGGVISMMVSTCMIIICLSFHIYIQVRNTGLNYNMYKPTQTNFRADIGLSLRRFLTGSSLTRC